MCYLSQLYRFPFFFFFFFFSSRRRHTRCSRDWSSDVCSSDLFNGSSCFVNEARTAIEAAKALDPNLPEIYTSEGALKFYYDWDWKGAVESYKKALELDPGNATIYIRYSSTLAAVGRYKEALPLADKAAELDPVSISSLHNLGWTNLIASNFQKSADAFQKALDLHPNWVWGYIKQA